MSCISTMVCFQSKSFSCLLVGSRNDSCLGMTSTMEDFNPCLLVLTTMQSRIVDLLNFYKLVKLFENYFKKVSSSNMEGGDDRCVGIQLQGFSTFIL